MFFLCTKLVHYFSAYVSKIPVLTLRHKTFKTIYGNRNFKSDSKRSQLHCADLRKRPPRGYEVIL